MGPGQVPVAAQGLMERLGIKPQGLTGSLVPKLHLTSVAPINDLQIPESGAVANKEISPI